LMGATGVSPVQYKPGLARSCFESSLCVCADSRLCGHESTDAERTLGTPTNKLRANQHWRDASGTRNNPSNRPMQSIVSFPEKGERGDSPQRKLYHCLASGDLEDVLQVEVDADQDKHPARYHTGPPFDRREGIIRLADRFGTIGQEKGDQQHRQRGADPVD